MTLLTNVLTESLNTNYPFWQAPLPFNLIRAQTAGQISAHGALGMIRIAAHDNVVKLKQIIDAYQTYHDRPCFCFAHHLPQMQSAALFSYETFYNLANYLSWQVDEPDLPQPDHFLDLLETAIDANPRAIGFANGIPNKEIKIGFTDIILNWIKNEYNISSFSFKNTFINLINNNITEFEKGLRNIMQDSISYFDIGANYKINKEQLFHVYTLGLLAVLNDDYIIKSNRESGEGRYDIILIPKNKSKTGVIIEIKSIEPQKDNEDYNTFASRVNNTIEKAINQINKNNYNKELINNNIKTENIINLPIVFAGKKPFVKKQEIKNT